MSNKITNHTTGVGEIQFMAVARPLNNKFTGKEEYSIRLLLDENDPCVEHLRGINDRKIDNSTNRKLAGTGKVSIGFTTAYKPTVVGVDGEEILEGEVPFFNGLNDKGTGVVMYTVVEYDKTSVIRLAGVRLKSLELAPREEGESTASDILSKLKEI